MKSISYAFSLAEMVVVMLILTIILAASTPLITRKLSSPKRDVIYKVVTIQVPTPMQGNSQVLNNVELSGPNAKNELNKIIYDQQQLVNEQYQQAQQTQQTPPIQQNQQSRQLQSTQYSHPLQNSKKSGNILNQEVVNIETVQDKYGEPQTVVTLSSGEKVVVSANDFGQPTIKTFNGKN